MSSSISVLRAKATHDAAMSIIEMEARARAAKTEHLRQLRLAAEAEAGTVDRVALPRSKTPLSAPPSGDARGRRVRSKRAG
ncbi:hypothetical protein [Taklimakanibacter deserti]|uniref:hypothetical protein n=1 Tax=Taklimakanibacter deserti TaxID=2267839 RepID=UPI000E64BF5B